MNEMIPEMMSAWTEAGKPDTKNKAGEYVLPGEKMRSVPKKQRNGSKTQKKEAGEEGRRSGYRPTSTRMMVEATMEVQMIKPSSTLKK
jgi:hypothetical protein